LVQDQYIQNLKKESAENTAKIETIESLTKKLKEYQTQRQTASASEIRGIDEEIEKIESKIDTFGYVKKGFEDTWAPAKKAADAVKLVNNEISQIPTNIDKAETSTNEYFSKFDAFLNKFSEGWAKFGQEIQAAIQGASDVVNQFYANQTIKRENAFARFEEQQNSEIEKLEERRDRELAIEDLTAQQKEAINRKYDSSILKLDNELEARRRRLRIKEARAQKAQAIFSATINTAVGVSAALASLNPVLAAIIGTLGAAQVAAIASQPIHHLVRPYFLFAIQ